MEAHETRYQIVAMWVDDFSSDVCLRNRIATFV
jgi:hypothetical protein